MTTKTFGCVGNTIKLRSGLYLDLAIPQPDQFTFLDIAGALSKICRFGAQIPRFYSVAEHSMLCAIQAYRDGHDNEVQAAVLLHDAAEAFIGDVVKPLKLMLPDYSRVESQMEKCIFDKYGIEHEKHKDIIREIDQSMLINERNQLFGADDTPWTDEHKARNLGVVCFCFSPEEAETHFVASAEAVGVDINN